MTSPSHPGTVGRPYPVVELRIADPDADGVGEVLARSPTVMNGYVGRRHRSQRRDRRRRRLAALRRPRPPHRGRLPLHRRPQQGRRHPRRREHRLPARRGGDRHAPRRRRGGGARAFRIPTSARSSSPWWCTAPTAAADREEDCRVTSRACCRYFAVPTRWEIRTEPLPTLAGEKVDKKALAQVLHRLIEKSRYPYPLWVYSGVMSMVLEVSGMSCAHCVAAITAAVSALPGVDRRRRGSRRRNGARRAEPPTRRGHGGDRGRRLRRRAPRHEHRHPRPSAG